MAHTVLVCFINSLLKCYPYLDFSKKNFEKLVIQIEFKKAANLTNFSENLY